MPVALAFPVEELGVATGCELVVAACAPLPPVAALAIEAAAFAAPTAPGATLAERSRAIAFSTVDAALAALLGDALARSVPRRSAVSDPLCPLNASEPESVCDAAAGATVEPWLVPFAVLRESALSFDAAGGGETARSLIACAGVSPVAAAESETCVMRTFEFIAENAALELLSLSAEETGAGAAMKPLAPPPALEPLAAELFGVTAVLAAASKSVCGSCNCDSGKSTLADSRALAPASNATNALAGIAPLSAAGMDAAVIGSVCAGALSAASACAAIVCILPACAAPACAVPACSAAASNISAACATCALADVAALEASLVAPLPVRWLEESGALSAYDCGAANRAAKAAAHAVLSPLAAGCAACR